MLLCSSGRPNLCQSSWKARSEGTLQSGSRRVGRNGREGHSGISAFAEYAVVSETSLVRIPKELPLTLAAIFRWVVVTGVGAVLNTARDVAGRNIHDLGARRDRIIGVARSRSRGCSYHHCDRHEAIETRTRKEWAQRGESLGSDPDCVAKIKEVTDGGVDYAMEMQLKECQVLTFRLCHRTAGQHHHLRRSSTSRRDISYSTSRTGSDERVIMGFAAAWEVRFHSEIFLIMQSDS